MPVPPSGTFPPPRKRNDFCLKSLRLRASGSSQAIDQGEERNCGARQCAPLRRAAAVGRLAFTGAAPVLLPTLTEVKRNRARSTYKIASIGGEHADRFEDRFSRRGAE